MLSLPTLGLGQAYNGFPALGLRLGARRQAQRVRRGSVSPSSSCSLTFSTGMRAFPAQTHEIPSASMVPTLQIIDRIVEKLGRGRPLVRNEATRRGTANPGTVTLPRELVPS